jgi:hypothetical protein
MTPTSLPAHTPYDGTSKLFTAGLRPLDLADWTEAGPDFHAQLLEKRRLYAAIRSDVQVEESGTEAAQREVLALLAEHLPARFPDTYRRRGDRIEIDGMDAVEVGASTSDPLRAAALLVAEDLILMRRSDAGWRLAAGSLCFPSHWVLKEKFGSPMQQIHQPVPGFGPGTRMAEIINRMFDSLKVEQPMQRFNWSLQKGGDLYRPFSTDERTERAAAPSPRFSGTGASQPFMRVERQTLRRLPVSGDILFTIRIHLDPLEVLFSHPERWAIAHSFADQLLALDQSQLAYKGFTADRDLLVTRLRDIAST